jgi:HAD superfamily hydrolase (TIGR01490 family)
MPQPLYVFDMDETLINGDCSVIWNEFLVDKGIVTDPDFLKQDQEMMSQYAKGELNIEDYLNFTLAPLTQHPKSVVDELVEECVTTRVLPKLFGEARTLIEELSQRNVPMLIVSATVTFIVSKVGQQIGISNALGIDLVEESGCYTSRIDGVPSYREGKINRLKSWIAAQSQPFSEIHFYTDSINDLPLCLHADHVYLINPAEKLRQHAEGKQHWQIYSW